MRAKEYVAQIEAVVTVRVRAKDDAEALGRLHDAGKAIDGVVFAGGRPSWVMVAYCDAIGDRDVTCEDTDGGRAVYAEREEEDDDEA